MTQTLIGLALLLTPFLLLYRYKNKILGFAYILLFIITLNLTVALVTQVLNIFTYSVVIGIHTIISLIIIFKASFDKFLTKLKPNLKRIDWVLVFVLIITFICLYSVHYNYTGKYSVATSHQYQDAEHMSYSYPYFADEWYAIAFIKDSINNQSLPFNFPLTLTRPSFINFEFPFHSFLAGMILLLNLDPLTNYTVLTIFTGLLICLLIYLFLRQSNIQKMPAAIAALSVLYITNGANLAGLWTLIPLILGIISMLLGFIFLNSNKIKTALLAALVTLIFYPPLFIFYSLAIIFFLIQNKKLSSKDKLRNILYYFGLSLLVAIVISLSYFTIKEPTNNFFPYLFSKIIYPSFTKGFIPEYSIFSVIPLSILILAAFGIFSVIKKRLWLTVILLTGLAYWFVYSLTTFRFIIEYQRVIVFTAILVTIVAGFGLNYLIKLFKKNKNLEYIQISVLILFLIFSFNYTKNDNWQDLKAYDPFTGQSLSPAAPANKYLHPDDLKLFKNIKNKWFLSLPWKGTVIGVATNNYPFSTKHGTISVDAESYYQFMQVDCNRKYEIIKSNGGADYLDDYIYSSEFNCPNFELIGKSSEGFHLYRLVDSK